jgi:ribose 1,5-bisphosphokinase
MLAGRVAARGRSSDGNVGDRLRRIVSSLEPDVIINNVGSAEEHAADLLQAIDGV